jgi:hypothetical protein
MISDMLGSNKSEQWDAKKQKYNKMLKSSKNDQ